MCSPPLSSLSAYWRALKCIFTLPLSAPSHQVYPTPVFELGRGQITPVLQALPILPGVLHFSRSPHQHANGSHISSPLLVVSHFSRTRFPRRLNMLRAWASYFPLSFSFPLTPLFLASTPSLPLSFISSFKAGGCCTKLTTSFSAVSLCCINSGQWIQI